MRQSTAQSDHAAPASCSATIAVRDPRGLLHLVRDAGDVDLARAVLLPRDAAACPGRGAARPGAGRSATSAASRIRAPERKFVYRGSLVAAAPSARRELLRELQQVEQRGAAPRVDVLVGVAHGRHRMAVRRRRRPSAAPAPRSCPGTRRAAPPRSGRDTRRATSGCRSTMLSAQLDLVAEVDHAELALQLPEDRAAPSPARCAPCADPIRAVGAMLLELLEPLLVERDDLVAATEVVGRLIVEGQDRSDDAGLPLGLDDLERHPVEDPRAELDPLRRREDPLVRLDPDRARRGGRGAGPRTRGSW